MIAYYASGEKADAAYPAIVPPAPLQKFGA